MRMELVAALITILLLIAIFTRKSLVRILCVACVIVVLALWIRELDERIKRLEP